MVDDSGNRALKGVYIFSALAVGGAALFRLWNDNRKEIAQKKQMRVARAEQHINAYAAFVQTDGTEYSSLAPTGFLLQ